MAGSIDQKRKTVWTLGNGRKVGQNAIPGRWVSWLSVVGGCGCWTRGNENSTLANRDGRNLIIRGYQQNSLFVWYVYDVLTTPDDLVER